MNMTQKVQKPVNPHQEAIDALTARVLPRVKAMPFAVNRREPWLGNSAVDKAVIATIETIFALADEDRNASTTIIQSEGIELPEMDQS